MKPTPYSGNPGRDSHYVVYQERDTKILFSAERDKQEVTAHLLNNAGALCLCSFEASQCKELLDVLKSDCGVLNLGGTAMIATNDSGLIKITFLDLRSRSTLTSFTVADTELDFLCRAIEIACHGYLHNHERSATAQDDAFNVVDVGFNDDGSADLYFVALEAHDSIRLTPAEQMLLITAPDGGVTKVGCLHIDRAKGHMVISLHGRNEVFVCAGGDNTLTDALRKNLIRNLNREVGRG